MREAMKKRCTNRKNLHKKNFLSLFFYSYFKGLKLSSFPYSLDTILVCQNSCVGMCSILVYPFILRDKCLCF